MMPNDIWHRKTTIYSDTDSIVREERARRRLLRIQQVRLQSKEIANRVIEKSKQLQKYEEKKEREKKENVLREWKKCRLDELKNELNHGISTLGESYKAVDQDLAYLKEKQEKEEINKQTAKERGVIAFQVELAEKEVVEQKKEKSRTKREHLRFVENERAKSVASLPPIIKAVPEVAPCKTEGTKIEVIDFSVPRSQRTVQFKTVPDDVVQKVSPETHKINAAEEAVQELKAKESKSKKAQSTVNLAKWLGNAANARKALEKDYKSLFSQLKDLEKEEIACRPIEALSVDDINDLEKRYFKQKKALKASQIISKMSEDQNRPPSPQAMDFTDFPGTHFTAEEAGALGPNAHSLQTLLDNLAGESRRRLQEVVGEDYYYCSDDDFATPPHSPVNVCVESTSTVQVSGAASVTSEVSVSVRSGGKHKKKKKKKGKKRREAFEEKPQQSFLSTNSTQYMSPPERLQEDNIAGYLANIEHEKEQLKRELNSKKSAIVDTTLFVTKLLDMTRESVGNLPVSAESSMEQPMEVPSKKKKSSSCSSSSYYSTLSDTRDGIANGQSSRSEEISTYKEASTAYLSLNLLENKDPLETNVEPNPGASDILTLINAPAEPLVRPMENLRLSTIIEADSSVASSKNANESQTLDIESELIKRGLPLPPTASAAQEGLQAGPDYLRRMRQLPHFSDSSSSAENQLGNVFHSTPVDVTTESSGRQFSKENLGVSPIPPSSE
ncbi:uncharacterized protein LOC135938135 [Cloeon dipterum]|uniref:uncharacterized protein LOC135938135 n=1 Tax=Cloeon dipterum TaxID=197152 RepID=UPI0032207146